MTGEEWCEHLHDPARLHFCCCDDHSQVHAERCQGADQLHSLQLVGHGDNARHHAVE